MKYSLVVAIALIACSVYSVNADGAKSCGGGCSSSVECAVASDDLKCRCSYLTCQIGAKCSGGCLTSKQCSDWAGGDSNCVCTWWFECEDKNTLENPGYLPFLKMAAMAKQNKILKAQELEQK